jgi:hypothetical protein
MSNEKREKLNKKPMNTNFTYILFYGLFDDSNNNIDDILISRFEKVKKQNDELNISGFTLFHPNNRFISYIEGVNENVELAFRDISRNQKNKALNILTSGKAKERKSVKWVAFWPPKNEQDLQDLRAFVGDENFHPVELIKTFENTFVGELLKDFYKEGGINFSEFWSKKHSELNCCGVC